MPPARRIDPGGRSFAPAPPCLDAVAAGFDTIAVCIDPPAIRTPAALFLIAPPGVCLAAKDDGIAAPLARLDDASLRAPPAAWHGAG